MTDVDVVVPNWNGARLLHDCLTALTRQSRPAARVVVVDDASSDDSIAVARRALDGVTIVALERNRGFACAANAGIAATRAPLVALLNNDAVAEPGWLAALASAADAHPDAHAFACRMVTFDEPPRIDSAGLALAHGFAQLSIGGGDPDGAEYDRDGEVLGACGGAALYRRALFDRIGAFDESLGFYWEDYDLALRALNAGLRARYVAGARVRHRGSATIGRHSARGVYHYRRNRRIVLRRNVPLALRLRELPRSAVQWLKDTALYAARGRLPSCLAGDLVGALRPVARAPMHDGAAARLAAWLDEGSRLRLALKRKRRKGHGT
jgi:GT2 family glycosyltransferase